MTLRVLIAPDKLKGSLTAAQAADAIARGVIEAWPAASVRLLPIADGGEGVVEALVAAGRATPLRTEVGAFSVVFAVLNGAPRTIVAEVAQVGGLGGRRPTADEARSASSWAAGALVRAALDLSPARLVIGIGGTASTDAGAGALAALGAAVLDRRGRPIRPGLDGLADAARVELAGVDRRVAGLVVATDVDSPLVGPAGAVRMFGPQKGLGDEDLAEGEAAVERFAQLLERASGVEVARLPGAGAGGGLAAGLAAVAGGAPRLGSEIVFELLGVDGALAGADIVITAEGSLDGQSLRGKAPIMLARRAAALGVPCLAVAGAVTLSPDQLRAEGITASAALFDLQPDVAEAMANASALLTRATAELLLRSPFPG